MNFSVFLTLNRFLQVHQEHTPISVSDYPIKIYLVTIVRFFQKGTALSPGPFK